MRIGMNPNRVNKQAAPLPTQRPALIVPTDRPVVLVITHLPELTGWHASRLEIVKHCLRSARRHAGADHHFAVWDNASCKELVGWIRGEFRPDSFHQSANVGKVNAYKLICEDNPEAVISFSDDDMLYYPGWLAAQMEIWQSRPLGTIAEVSCGPTRYNTEHYIATGKALPHRAIELPPAWDTDWGLSIGSQPSKTLEYLRNRVPYEVDLGGGLKAILGAAHCQYMTLGRIMAGIYQYSPHLMIDELSIDGQVDRAGYLRLTTRDRYVRHIGNIMTERDRKEAEELSR